MQPLCFEYLVIINLEKDQWGDVVDWDWLFIFALVMILNKGLLIFHIY
jgi:hypothetical protein